MEKKTRIIVLVILFLLATIIKLSYGISSDSFNDIDSYYTLRQIESFSESRTLLYEDELSFSGKDSVFLPAFYIALSIPYMLFHSIPILKVIIALLSAISVIMVFLITKDLIKKDSIALALSFCSIFIPIMVSKTTNTLTSITISIPLLLLCLYLFSEYGKSSTKSLLYIISLFLLCTTSPLSLILLLTITIYIILLKTERITVSRPKKEISIFSSVFIVWLNLILFKKAIQVHGLNAIWQNIPTELILNFYSSLNMISILYFIGIIPFVFAIYGLYKHVYKTKKSEIYVYVAFISSIFIVLLFRLIQLEVGLILLGTCFIIFSSLGLNDFIIFMKKTKGSKFLQHILVVIAILFIITSMIPALRNVQNNQISSETIEALEWIKFNTKNDSIIIGTIKEGHLISQISKRKNIIDTNFLLNRDVNERYHDLRVIYTSPIAIKALEIANKYNADYILIDNAIEEYEIEDLRFKDSSLVEKVYEKNSIKIYKIKARVEKYE